VPTPLLQTKLYIPPVRPEMVPRPRLLERLDEGLRLGRKLTLVSALAGFGKTTLLSEWIHSGVSSREYGVGEEHESAGEVFLTPYY
jgi:ATP/maltotriose-dependent transcriptional regulator MalT